MFHARQSSSAAGWLTDNFGPRVSGTPAMRQAGDWAVARLKSWGLANVHEEPFPFGKGWSLVRFHANLIAPQPQPIIGHPKGWSPSTKGTVTADVVQAVIRSDADFAKYRGTLKDKIVLTQPAREVRMLEGRVTWRMSEADLSAAAGLPVPAPEILRAKPPARPTFDDRLQEFFFTEGVVATLDRGADSALVMQHRVPDIELQRPDGGTIFVGRLARPEDDHSRLVPSAVIAVEHYNRMVRLLEKKTPVKMELHVETAFPRQRPDGRVQH